MLLRGQRISGNGRFGVSLLGGGTSGNVLQGNVIRATPSDSGDGPLPNAFDGVFIRDGAGTTIGGTVTGAGNLISGNGRFGIRLESTGTAGTLIQGNKIGTDATGTQSVANGVDGDSVAGALGNTIGGTVPGAGNVIAFNGRDGVVIDTGTGNAIRQNSIFGHTNGLGIALLNNGNRNQPAPTVDAAFSDGLSITIAGSLATGTASTSYTVDFFANPVCNPSGFGEGRTFLASETVTTDGSGRASFQFTLFLDVPQGQFISATATATDPGGNTSAFAACVVVNPYPPPGRDPAGAISRSLFP